MIKSQTADLMRRWRQLAGLSRVEAAARLSMSRGTIRDIEQGLTRADDVFVRLALEKLIEDSVKAN